MPDSNVNAGLDAGPDQTWCGAGSALGPESRETFTPLVGRSAAQGRDGGSSAALDWDGERMSDYCFFEHLRAETTLAKIFFASSPRPNSNPTLATL